MQSSIRYSIKSGDKPRSLFQERMNCISRLDSGLPLSISAILTTSSSVDSSNRIFSGTALASGTEGSVSLTSGSAVSVCSAAALAASAASRSAFNFFCWAMNASYSFSKASSCAFDIPPPILGRCFGVTGLGSGNFVTVFLMPALSWSSGTGNLVFGDTVLYMPPAIILIYLLSLRNSLIIDLICFNYFYLLESIQSLYLIWKLETVSPYGELTISQVSILVFILTGELYDLVRRLTVSLTERLSCTRA